MEEWLVIRRPSAAKAGTRGARAGRMEMVGPDMIGAEAVRPDAATEPGVKIEAVAGLDDHRDVEIATRPMPLALIEPTIRQLGAEAAPALAAAKAKGRTWGLEILGADPDRHDGKGVKVAVIDTGIARAHPAFGHLAPTDIVEANFTDQPGGIFGVGVAKDTDGHGTHCAGTICGGVVDGIRIGLAPKISKLLVAKAIGGQRGSTALLEALDWAVTNKADVISMSLGFDFVSYQRSLVTVQSYKEQAATSMALTAFRDNIRIFDAWMDLLEQRRAQGFDPVVVAASGNQSDRPTYVVEKSSPSAAQNVISVGALGQALEIAGFSNGGPTFVAPGVDVISADTGTGLAVMRGTSMACPHIAGLAALYWQVARSGGGRATSSRVLRMMETSAEKHFVLLKEPTPADVGGGMPKAPGI